jgi:hypothetical protein
LVIRAVSVLKKEDSTKSLLSPRAWQPVEGHLSVVTISIRFERFLFFKTPALPEVMILQILNRPLIFP